MPSRFARLLALAIATVLTLSLPAAADAAKKKSSQHSTAQTSKSTAKAKPKAKSKAKNKTRTSTSRSVAPTTALKQDKATQLNRIYDDYWEASLRLNPLQASFQGDTRYNDQLPNFLSAAFRQQSHDFTTQWLSKVEALGPDGLTGQDLLSYEIFVRDARGALEAEHFPSWMQPINQYYNIASIVVMLGSGMGAQPFQSPHDYDNWSRRSLGIQTLFDQAISNMREGIQAGVVQPRELMQKVLPQLDAIIKPTAEESLFWTPIRNLPVEFSEQDKQRISAEYKRMIEFRIMPAYRALRGFIATEYLPACRTSSGRNALPNGAQWYAYEVRQSTTTDLTPEQIHHVGLDEVQKLQLQIQQVMKQVKFRGSMQKFFSYMQSDKRFAFDSETQLLDYYRSLQTRIDANAAQLFALTPKAKLEIHSVEPYRAQTAASASYMRPVGERPGILYVNSSDLSTRHTWEAENLYLHEAIPGHHYQLGLQQELAILPKFRRLGGETAFIEGWGLYAESLGKELGGYSDPYSYYGYLQNELGRAIRLVVDTGLHSQGWSRQQAIDYMQQNSALSASEAEAEVDRYTAIPGQALAYKVGEMKIWQLREQAEHELGAKFDLRQFHAEVLKDGSVPLSILQQKIERWIAASKSAGAAP